MLRQRRRRTYDVQRRQEGSIPLNPIGNGRSQSLALTHRGTRRSRRHPHSLYEVVPQPRHSRRLPPLLTKWLQYYEERGSSITKEDIKAAVNKFAMGGGIPRNLEPAPPSLRAYKNEAALVTRWACNAFPQFRVAGETPPQTFAAILMALEDFALSLLAETVAANGWHACILLGDGALCRPLDTGAPFHIPSPLWSKQQYGTAWGSGSPSKLNAPTARTPLQTPDH